MKLIHILPVSNLHCCEGYRMFMALTHLVENNVVYREWCKRYEGYLILDNSIVELGGAVSMKRLCDAAEAVEADEIILPDEMEDGAATISKVKDALNYLYKRYGKHCPFKLHAVVQGKTLEEITECFQVLDDMPDIDVIGIPKHLHYKSPTGRPGFESMWSGAHKAIHLLGLAHSFTELVHYEHPEDIRSCDTSLMTVLVKNNLACGAYRPSWGDSKIDFEKDFLSNSQYMFASTCIQEMLIHGWINPRRLPK